METRKILAIVVLALGLIVCQANVSRAADIGSAFTYQGRLLDVNSPADDLYDFMFTLYDSNDACDLMAGPIEVNDLDVIEGYFTVELDFGQVFDGNDLWLEIGVRPGELAEPEDYTFLDPLVELMPAPHAIYAKIAGSDSDWMISGDDMYSIPTGNVGIGTTGPGVKLDVAGDGIRVYNDSGAFLMATANAESSTSYLSLTAKEGPTQREWRIRNLGNGGGRLSVYDSLAGERMVIDKNGNVGIGTASPTEKLEVAGAIKATVSDGNAVVGQSVNHDGIQGFADTSGFSGVFGKNDQAGGHGVSGFSHDGRGVFGLSGGSGIAGHFAIINPSNNNAALEAFTEGGGPGVYGASESGTGGYFTSTLGYGLIVDSGNVGIGTDSPTSKLQVISSTTPVAGWFETTKSNGNTNALEVVADACNTGDNRGLYILALNNGDGDAYSIYSPRTGATMYHEGKVGIGMTDPLYQLDVYGNMRIQAGEAGVSIVPQSDHVHFAYRHSSGFNVNFRLYETSTHFLHDIDIAGDLTANGQVYVPNMSSTATSYKTVVYNESDDQLYYYDLSSSARYKENIKPLHDDFSKVLQAESKSFVYKANGEPGMGFIAEEFDDLGLSNLVTYKDGQPDGIKYDMVPLYLLEVLKDQAQTTDQLKAENDSLKKQLKTLKAASVQRNEKIETRLAEVEAVLGTLTSNNFVSE